MSETPDVFERLYDLLRHEELRKALFVVLPSTLLAGFWFGRYFPRHVVSLPTSGPVPGDHKRIAELEQLIADLKNQLAVGPEAVRRAREALSLAGPGLWLAVPPKFPQNYHVMKSSIPIFTIANLKGGVGKTTIAIGLASHFANPFGDPERKRERVLLIDLDFQGSLSSMALTNANRMPLSGGQSRATRLMSGRCTGEELVQMHQRVKGLDAIPSGNVVEFYAIPAYYDLAQAENSLMMEWLLDDSASDVRYNLAEVLLSEEVQSTYDRIIIDAPPRLTTAHVQALAASTHVIIPTVLDRLSGEAVGGFVEQAILHAKLWPHLKLLGVVGSMTEWGQDKDLQDYEQDGLVAIAQALEEKSDAFALRGPATRLLPRNSFIPEVKELGRAAGTRIGYLSMGTDAASREACKKVRCAFDSLGNAVVQALSDAKQLKDLVRT